jgi:hypothetical protein
MADAPYAKASMYKIDADETLLATIYRHPFGIVSLYVQVLLGVAAAGGLIVFLLPTFISREEQPNLYNLLGVAGLLIVGFLIVVLLIATVIYNQSKLVVTDKTITQILQEGLFNRRISQLSVSNIEDVTANRSGLFQSILNYGTLYVETAGEQENFHFAYCPNPDHFAKVILEARQAYVEQNGSERFGVNIPPRTSSGQAAPAYNPSNQPPYPYPQPPVNPQGTATQNQPQAAPPYQQPYYQPPAEPASVGNNDHQPGPPPPPPPPYYPT